MLRKLPIVGIFGRGAAIAAERAALARETGALVARLGAHLLTGAGYGVMEAAAQGFVAVEHRAGLSIGVVPRRVSGGFDEPNRTGEGHPYPNSFVEIAIFTPLPPRVSDWTRVPARNHVNVLTADAVIALPGSKGTNNELDMTAHYRNAASHPPNERRVILLGPADEFLPAHRDAFVRVENLADAERHLRAILSIYGFEHLTEAGHAPAVG